MQLEDLTKSNLATVLGLGLLTVAAAELVPNLRPALKSAIKVGLAILVEAEEEAEVELIRALVLSTVEAIGEVLSRPAGEDERRRAVRRRIRHFQRQALSRAESWNADEHERHRCYRRHLAQLRAHLVEKKQHVGPAPAAHHRRRLDLSRSGDRLNPLPGAGIEGADRQERREPGGGRQ